MQNRLGHHAVDLEDGLGEGGVWRGRGRRAGLAELPVAVRHELAKAQQNLRDKGV